MRVLVTRPAAQAVEWVERLRLRGIDAQVLPLIGIAAAADPGPLSNAWASLARQRLVVFVSANAVEQFFAHRGVAAPWPAAVQAGSTGRGTTQALRHASVPAAQIVEPAADAAQFDSESLWAQLAARDWRDANVLFVRAEGGREWLAERLRAAGASVAFVCAYRRLAPNLSRLERQLLGEALQQPLHHLWWFSSSQAIEHLARLAPSANWSSAQALATHPRIAEAARKLGFANVLQAPPQSEAIVDAIERSIRERSIQSKQRE